MRLLEKFLCEGSCIFFFFTIEELKRNNYRDLIITFLEQVKYWSPIGTELTIDKTKRDSLEKESCCNGILVIDPRARNELDEKKVHKIDESDE